MHFVFTPVGSGGDVRPFIAIAHKVVALGHQATVVAAEPFRDAAIQAGVGFVSIWSTEEYEREVLNPDLWDPRRGVPLVMKILTENLQPVWDAVASLYEEGKTIFVLHSLAFAPRAFAEKYHVPSATMHLQPNVFRTVYEQPVVIPGLDLNRVPRFLRAAMWRTLDRFMIDPIIAPALNSWRATHDLPALHRVFDKSVHSGELVLALFPEWFAARQPDWPPQSRHTGFPINRNANGTVDAQLASWIRDGEPPMVFTAGTANRQAGSFFSAAVDATSRVGGRALLLTHWRDQLPPELPPDIRWSSWAPLPHLLPDCAAYIHHGGVGSCADGLAAGVPQLTMPMAFDQHDNSARLERLGVAASIAPKKFDGARIAQTVKRLRSDPAVAAACAKYRALLAKEDGVANAANALVALASREPRV